MNADCLTLIQFASECHEVGCLGWDGGVGGGGPDQRTAKSEITAKPRRLVPVSGSREADPSTCITMSLLDPGVSWRSRSRCALSLELSQTVVFLSVTWNGEEIRGFLFHEEAMRQSEEREESAAHILGSGIKFSREISRRTQFVTMRLEKKSHVIRSSTVRVKGLFGSGHRSAGGTPFTRYRAEQQQKLKIPIMWINLLLHNSRETGDVLSRRHLSSTLSRCHRDSIWTVYIYPLQWANMRANPSEANESRKKNLKNLVHISSM